MEVQVLPPDQKIACFMVSEIIEKLNVIECDSIFISSVKHGIKSGEHNLVIDMIRDQSLDNRGLVSSMIGEDVLRSIESL